MFDGLILSEEPCGDVIILDPAKFDKPTGHFQSFLCWCHPRAVKMPMPNGEEILMAGHSRIIYRFSEDGNEPEK